MIIFKMTFKIKTLRTTLFVSSRSLCILLPVLMVAYFTTFSKSSAHFRFSRLSTRKPIGKTSNFDTYRAIRTILLRIARRP